MSDNQELFHVRLYMKSGNVIDLRKLYSFHYKKGINSVELDWETTASANEKLLTVIPDQIEAITQIFEE